MDDESRVRFWKFPGGQIVETRDRYYAASCDCCGWIGSSEECGTDIGGDDSDVYCPKCHQPGADYGKLAEQATPTKDTTNGR